MGETSIEWTDRSVNPLRARLNGRTGHYCEKVSQGCKNCYSSKMQRRFGMPQFQDQRNQAVEHYLDASKLQEVLRRKKPTKWFWCDMTDMFGDWVRFEWIAACFGVMAATPQHTHQVLTKRPDRMREFFEWVGQTGHLDRIENCAMDALDVGWPHVAPPDETTWPLPNVWLGTSAENQTQANRRIPELLQCPSAVRFVSAEPLLGPVDFTQVDWPLMSLTGKGNAFNAFLGGGSATDSPWKIDWVIVGGESGAGARPCNVDWVRSIVRQCKESGVACFVKQLGAHLIERNDVGFDGEPDDAWDLQAEPEFLERHQGGQARVFLRHRKGGDPSEWPEELRVREWPEGKPW